MDHHCYLRNCSLLTEVRPAVKNTCLVADSVGEGVDGCEFFFFLLFFLLEVKAGEEEKKKKKKGKGGVMGVGWRLFEDFADLFLF